MLVLAVPQLSDGTVMQTHLMGMAISPSQLLRMHVGIFTAVSRGMSLRDHRLMAPLRLLLGAHPLHKQRLTTREANGEAFHGVSTRGS
jgi:hypothetical protein